MSIRRGNRKVCTVADVVAVMDEIAPPGLAQGWDNVGLLAGDPAAPVHRVLACIDLTPAVADEAIKRKVDLILAYHPPIFKPIRSLRGDSPGTDAVVFRCLQHGIAIHAAHTALDAADAGTNDRLATLCGAKQLEPLEQVDTPGAGEVKLAVFVPPGSAERVVEAMFEAGAGRVGDYQRCAFRSPGRGSFFGGETTKPRIGERGRVEFVEELRVETVVPAGVLPAVVSAMIRIHPYEEPVFDLYPLKAKPVGGIGRIGRLVKSVPLASLARRLKRATGARCVQLVGSRDRVINRVVVVVGAAGSLPFRLALTPSDAIVTGEIRHHDALTIDRVGCTAIALGHWASERPVLTPLTARLSASLVGLDVRVSASDRDPFQPA